VGLSGDSRLQLSIEEMRALGHQAVELIVEHLTTLAHKAVGRTASRAQVEARLREPLPRTASPWERVLGQVQEDVLANVRHLDHPRFLALVPGPSNYVSVIADLLATGFNVFTGTWVEASGPAEVELVVIDWLREACGLPPEAGGVFVSGGSIANLTALAVARDVQPGRADGTATFYFSDQTHRTVPRALAVLGISEGQMRMLPLANDNHCCNM
jgi:aromatic-L-amino-acid decarboxylase